MVHSVCCCVKIRVKLCNLIAGSFEIYCFEFVIHLGIKRHTYYTIVECLCTPPHPIPPKHTITLKSYINIVCKYFSKDELIHCKDMQYLLFIRVKATNGAYDTYAIVKKISIFRFVLNHRFLIYARCKGSFWTVDYMYACMVFC